MIHEFSEWAILPNAMVFYEFLEMLGLIFLLLVIYEWYLIFKKCAGKKSQPTELF